MKYPDLLPADLARVGTAESRKLNLIVGRLVTDAVKTSLGPRGMEKIFTDIIGEDTITKHGGAFLRKVDVEHPVAKAIVEGVNTVDTHVGDGTVSAAILIGSLLKKADGMLGMGLQPATIIRGYERGLDLALETLDEVKMARDASDRHVLEQLAASCLDGKAITSLVSDAQRLRQMIVDACCHVADLQNGSIDVDDIKIEEKLGNANDIQLVRGTVIDKTIDNAAMPRCVTDARILLLNEPLETMRTKTDDAIEIDSPEQMSRFLEQEVIDVRNMVQKIIGCGAGVVVSRKGINDIAQECLAQAGIISIRRAKYNDLWWLEKATGASVCKSLDAVSSSELGYAQKVHERMVGDERMVFVEGCRNPRSVTILLRSNSKRYLDEFHRSALNALFVLRDFIQTPYVVPGCGSIEAVLADKIKERSVGIGDRSQIAVAMFADALEEIPLTLARNVGMDPLDTLAALRSHYGNSHGRSGWYGIDSERRSVSEMPGTGVIEPLVVKQQVLKTAAEVSAMILNVDDIFMKDEIDNTHCHIDGTVHAHHDGGKAHNHFEQEGLEQRQMHHYY